MTSYGIALTYLYALSILKVIDYRGVVLRGRPENSRLVDGQTACAILDNV